MLLPALFPRVDFPTLSLPNTLPEGSNIDAAGGNQCKPGFSGSWLQWCPIDFVIWAIISSVIIIMAWKLYSTNRVGPAATRMKGRKSTPFKKNGYYRLSFPHPTNSAEDTSPPYVEKDIYDMHGHEHLEFAGPTDPYHVVSTLDDSLIAKDHQFKHATMPEPVLSDKRAEKPSSLGFSPERDFSSTFPHRIETEASNLSATGQEMPGINMNVSYGQSGTFFNQHATPTTPLPKDCVAFEATPPPVYIPNPRLDTI